MTDKRPLTALDMAWNALLDCGDDTHGESLAEEIAHHRRAIEAAIRATLEANIATLVREAHEARDAATEGGLDVERLIQATMNVQGVANRDWVTLITAEYARLYNAAEEGKR